MNMWNVHRESRNTRNWFRYETFIYLFGFKVFRQEERERHNFFLCWLFHLNPDTCGTFRRPKVVSPRRGPKINLLRQSPKLNSRFFFKSPKSSTLPGMTSFTCPVPFYCQGFLLWHLWLSHPPRTRVNSCTQLTHALTNPYTKRKVLSLTKPKGKIYKTKNDNINII